MGTVAAIGVPLVGGLLLFINLSIAPLQKDIEQNARTISEIRQDVVPRREHQKDWDAQVKTDLEQDSKIERLRQEFGGTYSLRDALTDMKARLERIEMRREEELQRPHVSSGQP